MQRIAERLTTLSISSRWLIWPNAPEHGDASDYCYLNDGNLTELEDLTHGL
ncbi:MAG TPA: hypothetical protein VF916_02530 [Ktedonobacterales bacterium]